MDKKKKILIHIAFICYLIYPEIVPLVLGESLPKFYFIATPVDITFNLLNFYFFFYVLIPRFFRNKQILLGISEGVAVVFIISLIRLIIWYFLNLSIFDPANAHLVFTWKYIILESRATFVVAIYALLLNVVFRWVESSIEAKKAKEELQNQSKVNEELLIKQKQTESNCQPEITIISRKEDYFFVKTEHRLQKVNFNEILYIEGLADYLQIITRNEKILTLLNFRKMEEILPDEKFTRVHKSFMVAIDKINSIEKGFAHIEKKLIPIGNSYREPFFLKLKTMGLLQ